MEITVLFPPNRLPDSCLPFAFSKACDIPMISLLRDIGHDCTPRNGVPGVHIQELVRLLFDKGWAVIEFNFGSPLQLGDKYYYPFDDGEERNFLSKMTRENNGVILGYQKGEKLSRHALPIIGGIIYDPNTGREATGQELETMDSLYVVKKYE